MQADQPGIDFGASQARKQKVVDGLWKGLQGLMKSRKITTIKGTGSLTRGKLVRDRRRHRAARRARDPRVGLGAAHAPRLRRRRPHRDDLRRGARPRRAAVVGRRRRRRRHRLRVRVDDERPRRAGHGARGAAEAAAGLRRRRRQRGRAVVQAPRHRRAHRRQGRGPRRPTASGTTVHFGGDSVTVDVVVMSVGRRPLSDSLDLARHRGGGRPAGFVVVDELMRTGEDGVYAVGDLVATPQLAHVGFAEAIVAIQDILGEHATPVDYATVPWCIYCHPEVAFAGPVRAGGARRGPRRRRQEDAVLAQRPRPHRGRARGHGEGHRREGPRRRRRPHHRRAHGRARGSPSSSARATSR